MNTSPITTPGTNAVSFGSALQKRLEEALAEYHQAVDSNGPIDRDEFLEKYADIRQELTGYLDSFDLIRALAPELGNSSGNSSTLVEALPQKATLGDFRIIREIGRGGMGVVYEAEQLSIGRSVALKVLPFAAMLDRQQLNRFKNEARAAGTLDHPNIVAIYSVGCERGVHYYAMQLVEGQSLAQVVEQLRRENSRAVERQNGRSVERHSTSGVQHQRSSGKEAPTINYSTSQPLQSFASHQSAIRNPGYPLGAEVETERAALSTLHAPTSSLPAYSSREYFRAIAQLGVQAAEALDHAHQNGILHRDVKPANLLVDDDGKLWITDFGLARMEQDAGMTMTGDLLGTLRYLSPEQALAKRVVVDHRSDIYSLGLTLYELIALEPAFAGDDRRELLRQIAFEDPRKPRYINSRIPHDLETIVLKAIEKNPADRYSTAQELADDLQRFVDDLTIRARRSGLVTMARKWLRRHRPLVVSFAFSAAVLVLLSLAILAISNARIRREAAATAAALSAKEKAETKARTALQHQTESLRRLSMVIGSLFDSVGDTRLGDLPEMKSLRDELLKHVTGNTEKSRNDWQSWFSRGLIHYQFRELEKAIADLSRAIEINPEDSAPWQVRGFAHRAMGQHDKAIEDLTAAIRLNPQSGEYEPYLSRAISYFHLKRWDEAISDYDKVLEINPAHYGALAERAQSHYALKQFDAAVRDLTKAIEIARDQPFRFFFGHRALCLHEMGRYAEAAKDYEVAIKLRPNDAHNWINYASLLAAAPVDSFRDGKRAVELATKGCELSGYNNANMIDMLAQAYAETGNFEQAIKWSEKAIELANDVNGAEFEEHLDSFRNGKPWRDKIPQQ
jgi:serine/threonine protein kinase/Tfp pilus assembly protein PilF